MRALTLLSSGLLGVAMGCGQATTDGGFDDLSTAAATGSGPGSGASSASGASVGAGATTVSTGASGSGGGGCDLRAPADCLNADVLDDLPGDQGAESRVAPGVGSRWVAVRVVEVVEDTFDHPPIRYRASLEAPAGSGYQLLVYTGDEDGFGCSSEPTSASGSPLSIADAWEDDNAVFDHRWITFEVRHGASTRCEDTWTLTVEGNAAE